VAVLAGAGVASNGWASRFPEEVMRLEGYANAYSARREECHRDEGNIFPMEETCIYGADTPPNFAVWGTATRSSSPAPWAKWANAISDPSCSSPIHPPRHPSATPSA